MTAKDQQKYRVPPFTDFLIVQKAQTKGSFKNFGVIQFDAFDATDTGEHGAKSLYALFFLFYLEIFAADLVFLTACLEECQIDRK